MSTNDVRKLVDSVVMGEVDTFQELLKEEGLDVNGYAADDEMNALGYAAALGQIEFVKDLLGAGADAKMLYEDRTSILSYAGNCLFIDSSQRSNVEKIVALLVEAGADINHVNENKSTPIMDAIENPEYLEILINLGADFNAIDGCGKSVLVTAKELGVKQSIAALVAAGASEGGSQLVEFEQAAKENDLTKIKAMIAGGFDLTAIAAGNALCMAAAENCRELVIHLLQTGVSANARRNGDQSYFTPLIRAAYAPHPSIVEILLEAGADPQLEVEGVGNALDYAKLGRKENNYPEGEWGETIEILEKVTKGKVAKASATQSNWGYALKEDFGGNFDVLLVKGNEEQVRKFAKESDADDRVVGVFDTGWHSVYGGESEAIEFSRALETEVIHYYFGDASGDLGYSYYANGEEVEHYSYGEYFEEMAGSSYLNSMDTVFVDEETETQYRFKSTARQVTDREIQDPVKFIDSFFKSRKTYLGDEVLP